MDLPRILWLGALLPLSCSPEPARPVSTGESAGPAASTPAASYNSYLAATHNLNQQTRTPNGNYFTTTKTSDSTCAVSWGNAALQRVYPEPLPVMLADRLQMRWENQHYLILEYFTGSSASTVLALPLNDEEPVQAFANGRGFDAQHNLLVTEQGWGDTLLTLINLKTRQQQYLLEKARPATAVPVLDTVALHDGLLYYKCTVRTSSSQAQSTERRVRVRI